MSKEAHHLRSEVNAQERRIDRQEALLEELLKEAKQNKPSLSSAQGK